MAAVTALLAATPSARAKLILEAGPGGGNAGTDNVILNNCNVAGGTGLTVQGCLNSSPSRIVNFTSSEELKIEGGGQARVTAVDGKFDNIAIRFADPNLGFSRLIFNLDAVANGTATFHAVDQFNTVFNFGSFDLKEGGQNFFTLGSQDGQVAKSFTLLSTVDIQNISDLQQVRLGPTTIGGGEGGGSGTVPEPASLAVLGAGLAALGLRRRRLARA